MARVLVADDEPAIRDVIESTCKLDDHDVKTCASSEDAIAAYAAFAPDLLILDVRMPGGGAQKILDAVERTSGGKPLCPAIVVTGDVYDEGGELPRHPSIVELLKKPFGIDALRIAVKTALGPRSA